MSLILLALITVIPDSDITITASRTPVALSLSGTALTLLDTPKLTTLNLPLAADYLRLVPSVSVANTGPRGSQTQVRIRGAEARHTLTFIDGIKVNDPASGGEFRFETLLTDGVERIEVLRGPQSALWGPEAIGGVINIITRTPRAGAELFGQAEAGAFGTFNLGTGGNWGSDTASVTGQANYLNSTGIDTSNSGGDKDGYRNLSLSGKALFHPSPESEIGLVARFVSAKTRFDDFDYTLGQSADKDFSTSARAASVRGYARLSSLDGRWVNQIEAGLNDSRIDNYDAGVFLNRSNGSVSKLAYQSTLDFKAGATDNRVTGAVEYERQSFASIDVDPTALSNQQRSRNQTSVIGEYRLGVGEAFAASASLRHDSNSQYGDSTTFRTTAALALQQGVRAHASYGEGVNDPSFFDLFGFFPAFFVGNPNLVPEKSRGWDAGIGWKSDRLTADITYFHANLTDEIVSTFNSSTFLSGVANASGSSRRQGVEVSASTTLTDWLRLDASYAYLDATEQKISTGLALRELRRPRNSGSLTATVKHGAWQSSVSAAWVGERVDTNFATFSRQTLPGYVLVTVSGSYKINDRIALTGRVENAGDARYQDVIGYRTLGIGAYAGVKLNWGK